MKKLLSILAITVGMALLVGCTQEVTQEDVVVDETIDEETQEVAGTFFVAGDMGYGFENYVAPDGVVLCFELAQLETVNNGEPFCFSNTDEALEMLGCNEEGSLCAGSVVVEIGELPEAEPLSKDAECVLLGNCVPALTELKSVVEVL